MSPRTNDTPRIPSGIWVLGFVSLLMDVSSEMIHSLLPLFLVGTLGVSVLAVGVIEGLAEATALISKVFSGTLSDWLGRRKGLALLGYAMGAFSKPVFALAEGAGLVVAARFVDRVGKGIRGAPRDALVADLAPPTMRGAAFGLRQSLDTVGAFVGPLLAIALMLVWANDFRAVFWVAVIPGVLAVLLLWLGVREPAPDAAARSHQPDPPRGAGPAGARLLVGGGHWRGVHAGTLQRSLPGVARVAAGRARGLGAAGDGGHEPPSTRCRPIPSASCRTGSATGGCWPRGWRC